MRKQYIIKVLLGIIVTLVPFQILAQTFFTRTGEVSFHASTPLENIDANTNEATCVINMETGEVAFTVLMKSFQFRKSLMQEHFNENYVESSKYPKGSFKGNIVNPKLIVLAKEGDYPAEVEGEMTIHGVTKKIKTKGTIKITENNLQIISSLQIVPEDYNITIPSIVRGKIAKVVDVKVNALCKPLKK